jgi:hypothetical protein
MQTATCHTEGCGNAGHGIALDFLDPDTPVDVVVCGGCGQPITDVRDAS